MTSSRRKYMSVVGTIVAGALAGCSGGSNAPDANADTQELLPEAPEGWKKTDENEQLVALSGDGAQGGYAASYDTPDDVGGNVAQADYRIWIFRWEDNTYAREYQAENAESPLYVVQNNFSFWGDGPNLDDLITLFSNSPTLTEEYLKENNMNE